MMIVQSLWVGSKLSRMEYYSIKSFQKLGYNFILYTYEDVANVPKGTIIKDANDILDFEKVFTLKQSYLPFSDIWRYKMLYEVGGYWVDLDMIALKRFDENTDEYIFSSEHTIVEGAFKSLLPYVANIGVLKAPKGSLFFKELYDKCSKYNSSHNNDDKLKYMKIFRNQIKKYKLEQCIKPVNDFCPLDWWNAKEAFISVPQKKYGVQPSSIDDIINNSFTIHFWRDRITKKYKMDLDKKYNENSLWEKVLKKIDS